VTTSRKKIVELIQAAMDEPYKFDASWLLRFMTLLHKEDPKLAAAIAEAALKRTKENNERTIQDHRQH
jgi:hypothetical protein